MESFNDLDKIAITVKSHKLLKQLLSENPELEELMFNSKNEIEALVGVRNWIMNYLETRSVALKFYKRKIKGREAFEKLSWKDFAAIRILDYVDYAGHEYPDLNLRGKIAVSNPIKLIWLAVNFGTGGAKPDFFEDMLFLFRQFRGDYQREEPTREILTNWMERFVSGLDPRVIKLREENRDRIISVLIDKITNSPRGKYKFEEKDSNQQKYLKVLEWWKENTFHLVFAARTPLELNEMLGYSLDPDTMQILEEAEKAGIPFFVNPYYLSLLHVRVPYYAIGSDLAIRHYVVYSKQLVEEFGNIVAWEKEDKVEPGKPNAAGWLLPSDHNIHRRYPEVAILIPDTMGRACGGLCASCQRMYNFQKGILNFNLDKLEPEESWNDKLVKLMQYYEDDSQLRDILITGGDALMSSDASLKKILDAVLQMAENKRTKNKDLPEGKKLAEITRIRLGTRLPVYLPQRLTEKLKNILADFKTRAAKIGIKQFVVQTHFESPMEVTPEAKKAVTRLLQAGWSVTNQLVFTAAASRRGHTSKLRKVLNDIGIITYYTFTVKGYMENNHNFAPNARAVQEAQEEKVLGAIPIQQIDAVNELTEQPENAVDRIDNIRTETGLPFLATDRNVLNLPGVGKSLTFRVIGITRYGRRILEFDHDSTRNHSPIIEKMGKIIIIESKSISEYLRQLDEMGENKDDYHGIYGYSIGETEPRLQIFEYPEYNYETTSELTNLEV